MKIRKLRQDEHSITRELWEKVFSEDTKKFLDYYYFVKAKENEIYVIVDSGKIYSMLHLNPYQIKLNGKVFPSCYIVAVATEKEHRGLGFMKRLLCMALNDMAEQKIPFTFLMPAAEAIYSPYDFRFIYDQMIENMTVSDFDIKKKSKLRDSVHFCDAGLWDADRLAVFFEQHFSDKWDVYTVRDVSYYQTMILEQQSENGGVRMLYDGEKLVGCFAHAFEEGLEIREPLILEGYEEIFYASAYELYQIKTGRDIKTRGEELTDENRTAVKIYASFDRSRAAKKEIIMARIISLDVFLSALQVRKGEEINCSFAVIDPIIEKNSRIWRISGSSADDQLQVRETEDSEGVIPVAEFTQFLFGRKSLRELCGQENVIMTEHLKNELEKLVPLNNVFLNEIV